MKILGAVFGRAAVANSVYAGIGLSLLDGGTAYESLMQLALETVLGPGAVNRAVVDLLYRNVVGVSPDEGAASYYAGLLQAGTYTQASLGVMAADTQINQDAIALVGLVQGGLAFVPA